MLSYQHAYHIGAPADVFKHALLCAHVAHLQQKPAPVHVWDVHAGRGLYPLTAAETQKLNEYQTGLAHLWPWPQDMPAPVAQTLAPWHSVLAALNPAPVLQTLPGSSGCLAHLSRGQDVLHATEAHPAEFAHLKANLTPFSPAPILAKKDGYTTLKATLNPTHRNLVLLDPSYETPQDFENVAISIQHLHATAPKTAVHVWYPCLSDGREKAMINKVLSLNWPGTYHAVVRFPNPSRAYIATGHVVLGLPFNLSQHAQQTVDYLAKKLNLTIAANDMAVAHC